jgi:hypothetical protein
LGYATGAGIAKIVTEYAPHVKMHAVPTPGTTASARLYDKGEIDNVYHATWNFYQLYAEIGPFAESPPKKKAYQSWYYCNLPCLFAITLKVRDDITCWRDFAGKKVFPTSPGWASYDAYMEIFKALGILDEIKISVVEPMEAADALKLGTVDVVMAVSSISPAMTGWVSNIDAVADVKVVPPSEEEIEVIKTLPGLSYKVMPTDGFKQDVLVKEVWLPGFAYGFHWGPDTPEIYVYEITKALWEHEEEVKKIHAILKYYYSLEGHLAAIDTIPDIPVHPGAARYLKEIGKWKETWKIGEVWE